MGKVLSNSQVAAYHDTGLLAPIDLVDPEAAADWMRGYQSIADHHGGRVPARYGQKPHLLYPWLNQLIRHPAILDPVEDILGPNLLCWSAQFFAKPANDNAFVSWHQDATYWGLSSPEVVTAWVAFSPSNPTSGCMRVIPGTHKSQVEHTDTFAEQNLLSRGQEIAVKVDLDKAVDVVLEPGQMSLHHVLLFHGSEPNRSALPRVGYAIRYVPTHIHQKAGIRESATLVRGVDEHRHFDHEQVPQADLHPAATAHHKEVIDRQLKILYAGAVKAGRLGATVGL
jgi:non-haem Fe2+, alpha-ketoglutarate-dependent halogenase